MNVSFLYYMSQEKSHKKSLTLEAYGKVEKTLKTDPYLKRKKYKEINFKIFCSLYFSLAFLAVKIILLFSYLVGIRRPTH